MTQISIMYYGDDNDDNNKINLRLQRLRVLCISWYNIWMIIKQFKLLLLFPKFVKITSLKLNKYYSIGNKIL